MKIFADETDNNKYLSYFEKLIAGAGLYTKQLDRHEIALYFDKELTKCFMIGIVIVKNTRLSFADTKRLYQQLLLKYANNHHFYIHAPNGFLNKAYSLEQHNVSLLDNDYVHELQSYKKAMVHLLPYNQTAFKRILHTFESQSKVATIQATGTGKSYLACKYLQSRTHKRNLVLAPSNHIINQFATLIKDPVEYMTYSKLCRLTPEEIESYDTVVLDEFHRVGAEHWGSGVKALLDRNEQAQVLGLTATPIRFLDNERDMVQELFDGVVANSLSLEEALARNILPNPIYISALYTLTNYLADKIAEIKRSRLTNKQKAELIEDVDVVRKNWENSMGVPHIFKRYIKPKDRKFIVFAESISQLEDMVTQVREWMGLAFPELIIKPYIMHSNLSDKINEECLETFEKADNPDVMHLLFTVNILNEGIHISSKSQLPLAGIIATRVTSSPNIYYQQIGRALQANQDYRPLIFDLVNNFKNISVNHFEQAVAGATATYRERLKEIDLNMELAAFQIIDYTQETEKLFASITNRLLPNWDTMFKLYLDYTKDKRDRVVPYECVYKEQYLGQWVTVQRRLYTVGQLDPQRQKQLDDTEFIWDMAEFQWEQTFKLLLKHLDVVGHIDYISESFDNAHSEIGLRAWCCGQRMKERDGKLEPAKKERLLAIGFSFNPKQDAWDEMIGYLIDYKNEHGTIQVPTNYEINGKKVGGWLSRIRTAKSRNKLQADQVKQLENMGIVWDILETAWQTNYKALMAFHKANGHFTISEDYTVGSIKLVSWVATQRQRYKQGKLTKEHMELLNAIGFSYDVNEDIWQKNYKLLKEQIKDNPYKPLSRKELVDGVNVGAWAEMQRQLYKKGKLDIDKIALLEAISFPWDSHKAKWENYYIVLKEYLIEYDGTLPKAKEKFKEVSIGNWVQTQYRTYKDGTLSEERREKLESLGLTFKATA